MGSEAWHHAIGGEAFSVHLLLFLSSLSWVGLLLCSGHAVMASCAHRTEAAGLTGGDLGFLLQ